MRVKTLLLHHAVFFHAIVLLHTVVRHGILLHTVALRHGVLFHAVILAHLVLSEGGRCQREAERDERGGHAERKPGGDGHDVFPLVHF